MSLDKDKKLAEVLRAGFVALNGGDAKRAAECCRAAMGIDRDNPEVHFLVGLVALDMDDMRTAASAFGSVTKLSPSHAAAWAQLARIFMRMGQPARAEQALVKATMAGTDDPAVEDLIGVVASLLGNQREAKKWYQRAATKAPDRAAYGVNLASAQTFLGETDDAEKTLNNLLSRHGDIAQAHWLLSSLRKAETTDRADILMDKANRAKDAHSKAFLGYAAGKEYEDCEAWSEAFSAFSLGAKAKHSTLTFDEKKEDAMFAALMNIFSKDWAEKRRAGHDDPAPIFVVGQPRTGTTLIERIITSHSMVESAGELQQFGLSVHRLSKGSFKDRWTPEAIEASATIDPAALGREYLRASMPMRKNAAHFVDKLPGNYLHVPLILAALPNARIVHLTRDPMDSCFASFKQLFAEAYHHSYDQAEMARHHLRYARLMAHWREVFPGQFLDVSYEKTVSDLEPNARRLIDFLGLRWEDQCLEFHTQRSAVATASAVQVREKLHQRSVGRWRCYDNKLAPMETILREAGNFQSFDSNM
ncbi:tetratricopeptide repeat-containing sulfotransferase family protein [Hyphococcus lacteus]|uniref:Sulfotransferase n=1 Tax=Hyphococcus lacteus TaxID=3143536 RepID=A0ABV3Z6I7_9PROT